MSLILFGQFPDVKPADTKGGRFITYQGRVIFIGGPGEGGGGSGMAENPDPGFGAQVDGVSWESRNNLDGQEATRAPELEQVWDFKPENEMYFTSIGSGKRGGVGDVIARVETKPTGYPSQPLFHAYLQRYNTGQDYDEVDLGLWVSPVDAMRAVELNL